MAKKKAAFEKPEQPPHHIGCLNCGGGEMRRKEGVTLANMKTRVYGGFGGCTILCDGELEFAPPPDLDWKAYPTLMKFELLARKRPGDWRLNIDLPLRSAEYQRQDRNRWVLIKTGLGFA